jgi:hypothetical protein
MKRLLILGFLFSMAACSVSRKQLIGTYQSKCLLYLEPSVIMVLHDDNTFEYKFAQLGEKIKGTWMVSKKTLFLESVSFSDSLTEDISPQKKYTKFPGKDAFRITTKRLFSLTAGGEIQKTCYLTKIITLPPSDVQ